MTSLLLLLVACQFDTYPAPVQGSTYRITKDQADNRSEIEIDILTTDSECGAAEISNTALCRPKVDRSRAEVHLSFAFRGISSGQIEAQSLEADQITVLHENSAQTQYELIPHEPRDAKQLYVVIIDGSGSMNEMEGRSTRIQKVQRALESPTVQDAFFPPGENSTAVVLAQFTDKLRPLGGGEEFTILKNRNAYLRLVEDHLGSAPGGYTHLYEATRVGMRGLLQRKKIKTWIGSNGARPTVIVLTDGFNNQERTDTCGTNVSRLDRTLTHIKESRSSAPFETPILYTVGLGTRYRPGKKPESKNAAVTSKSLCGKFADTKIDGLLENEGIDHYSLAWLAEAGGGRSYVRRRSGELASVFAETAAKRYRWFEIRYQVIDSIWHRQSFTTSLRLRRGYQAQSSVSFLPNPWLDAPSATTSSDGRWMALTPLRHAFSLLLPILGSFIFLSFVGAAFFNASRAIFRRARPRK